MVLRLMVFLVLTLAPLAFLVGPIMATFKAMEARNEVLECGSRSAADVDGCLDSALKRHEAWNEVILSMTGQRPPSREP